MEGIASLFMEVMPAVVAACGLLWNFSKKVTKIEAQLQAMEHQIEDCKHLIEGNRQGRIEVFGVINGALKPKDADLLGGISRVWGCYHVPVSLKGISAELRPPK